MVWLVLTVLLTMVVFSIYFEQHGKRDAEARVTVKDHKQLEQEFRNRGAVNESVKHEYL
ncbi:hypothetical protein LCM20_13475 [Halobacillus litoralis]|uniref:hypothetical protein n=1 Tax=Halobacillus litoralis TaxID=45668 RepID=UPI001CD4C232|nr:hypothetical protein [Halobacillus litoralis]MCA0971612.1 hypothetical protein [Halobacillus litoralis]